MAIFDPPQNPHPLTNHQKIWYRRLRRQPLRLWQIWCKSFDRGLLSKWVKCNKIFFYLYLFSWTHLQVRPIDGFSRLMAQTTGTRKDVPFGGFVDITPHFGGEIPHHPNFGGINRHFQAKRQNIESFMLSKYCIDFNQILHNDRDDREGPLNVCVCVW